MFSESAKRAQAVAVLAGERVNFESDTKNFEVVTTHLVVSWPTRFDNEEEVRYVGTSV